MSSPPLPTQYTTSLVSYYPTQDGSYDDDVGIWSGGAGGMTAGQDTVPSGPAYIGLQFQLYELDPDQGLPLNPPIFPEPRPYDFVTGTAAESEPFTLSMSPVLGFGGFGGTLFVYIIPEANPEPYSTLLPPFSRGELDPTLLLGFINHPGGDYTRHSTDLDFSIMKPYIQHPNFRGKISLSIGLVFSAGRSIWYSTEGAANNLTITPEFAARQVPFHTGMMVGEAEVKRRTRAVHSYKSGFPYLADEAVPDGFTDGIMMHPDDYDDEDPVDQGRGDYVQSPSEGVVDDEVTDLEG